MKKIIIAMAAIAAAFTMASCSKEQPVSPEENATVGKSVVTASVENDRTKASLDADGNDTDGYKVFWSEGDKLFVADSDFEKWAAEYTLDKSSAGSSKGIFSWQNEDMFLPIDETYEGPVFEEEIEYRALYPSDFADMNSGAYIWKTEQTYTDMYIPMFAETVCTEEGTVDFAFTNLGGLLRLTVKGTAEIESITVTANEPMSGEVAYVMDDDEVNPIALMLDELDEDTFDAEHYITLDCKDGVELSSEGTDFYISIPCHYTVEEDGLKLDGYSNVSITLTDTEGRTCVKNLKNKNLVIERSKITTAAFTASEFKENIPEGALAGKFTINEEGDQVYFSKGNLYCSDNGEEADKRYTFAFEEQQYYYRTRFNIEGEKANLAGSVVNTPQNTSGLFQWVSEHASGITDDILASFGAFSLLSEEECENWADDSVDFGDAMGTSWSTLTFEEWAYLIGFDFEQEIMTDHAGRPNATKLFNGSVTVNGVYGVIIAPDKWDIDTYPIVGEGSPDSYDASAWSEMESKGLVFLPGMGYLNLFHGQVFSPGEYGAYWSKSAFYTGLVYILDFEPLGTGMALKGCQDAASVRLVYR